MTAESVANVTDDQIVEVLKKKCVETLSISHLLDHNGLFEAGIGSQLAAAMLECAGASRESGGSPGSVSSRDLNIEIRGRHALDLLSRIEAIQWQPRTPMRAYGILGQVPNTKKVLWKAVWEACSSEDPAEARQFCIALLSTSIFWEEEQKVFKSVARFSPRPHYNYWFREVVINAPSEGNYVALERMVIAMAKRGDTYADLKHYLIYGQMLNITEKRQS